VRVFSTTCDHLDHLNYAKMVVSSVRETEKLHRTKSDEEVESEMRVMLLFGKKFPESVTQCIVMMQ
jgi:hypothetical protein